MNVLKSVPEEKDIWVGPQKLTTKKKETRALYLFIREHISAKQLQEDLPCCFHNRQGQPSEMVFRTIFWDNSETSVVDCYFKDLLSIMKLTGIPASVLHFDFGVAQKNTTTAQINKLLKEEGSVAGALQHVA